MAALDAALETLGNAICARGGLLLLPGMHEISDEPELLLRLSNLLGPEVEAVREGEAPMPLAAHQQPQRQPLVRVHPVTGTKSLYLCGGGQMDFVTGPIAGMAPGPDGDGAALLFELLQHLTERRFTYTHEWTEGDLVIYDNRNLLHAGTWYDADAHIRIMWRTTVRGNPDPTYAGETYSWVPAEDFEPS